MNDIAQQLVAISPQHDPGTFGVDLAAGQDQSVVTEFRVQHPTLWLEEFIAICQEVRRRDQRRALVWQSENRILSDSPLESGFPLNAIGIIPIRPSRADVYGYWRWRVKNAKLPPLTKCAAEVTPRFEPVIDRGGEFPTFTG